MRRLNGPWNRLSPGHVDGTPRGRGGRRHRAEGAQRRRRGTAQLVHHVAPESRLPPPAAEASPRSAHAAVADTAPRVLNAGGRSGHRGAAHLVHRVAPESCGTVGGRAQKYFDRVFCFARKPRADRGHDAHAEAQENLSSRLGAPPLGRAKLPSGDANVAPRDPWARGARHPRNPPSPPPTPRTRAGGTDLHALIRPNTAARSACVTFESGGAAPWSRELPPAPRRCSGAPTKHDGPFSGVGGTAHEQLTSPPRAARTRQFFSREKKPEPARGAS